MKQNVIIKMKSIQSVYDNSAEAELDTKGSMSIEGDTFYISYEDSEATGFEGSVTKITVTGNRLASVSRTGSAASDLIMEPGKKHHCHYRTPYGAMEIGIYTHKIQNRLSDDGGDLYMKYTLDINSSYVSDNEIILNVRKT